MPNHSSKTPLYGDCLVTKADGSPMFRCLSSKANWYISKNLAEKVSDSPFVVRLTFEPAGDGHPGDKFYLGTRLNICVVCGANMQVGLNRHHIIPRLYRRQLPLIYKKHRSYDVVAMCSHCHQKYELASDSYRDQIGENFGVPYRSESAKILTIDLYLCVRDAGILHRYRNKIPSSRIAVLIERITKFLGHEPSNDEIVKLGNTCSKRGKIGSPEIEHAKTVIKIICEKGEEAIHEFEVGWRKHFLKVMNPKFMPEGWNVNYRHK